MLMVVRARRGLGGGPLEGRRHNKRNDERSAQASAFP